MDVGRPPVLDSHVFDSIVEQDLRDAAKRAFGFLAHIGIFTAQCALEKERLIQGDSKQDEQELAQNILEYRRVTQTLMTLDQLGQQYHKELN